MQKVIRFQALFLILMAAGTARADTAPYTTVMMCSEAPGSAGAPRTPYLGDYLRLDSSTFNWGDGAFQLRKDGTLALYPSARAESAIELGQADVAQYGEPIGPHRTPEAGRRCATFHVRLRAELTPKFSNSFSMPYPCTDSSGVLPSMSMCRKFTTTLSFKTADGTLKTTCAEAQIREHGAWVRRAGDQLTDPGSCMYAGSVTHTADRARELAAARADEARVSGSATPAEQLLGAARRNDLPGALAALAAGAAPGTANAMGTTAAMVAAAYSANDVLGLLLKQSIQVEDHNAAGDTAMHLAAMNGNSAGIRLLAASGAALNPRNEVYWAPLQLAFAERQDDAVRGLLDLGADVNIATDPRQSSFAGATLLLLSVSEGDLEHARLLLPYHPDFEALGGFGATGLGFTPLMEAAELGRADLVALLLQAGAKPNTVTPGGYTALAYAFDMYGDLDGRREAIRTLALGGADLNCELPHTNEVHPLIALATRGDLDLTRVFIAAHADVNVEGGYPPHTPLHLALANGHADVAQALRAAGAIDE